MSAAAAFPLDAAPRGRNLLVVDDDRLQVLILAGMARRCGFAVDTASSLDEAVARLRTRGYATIILDLSLGGRDGVELVRHVAEAGQSPSLLVVSGMEERIRDGALRYARAMGLTTLGTLRKPIHFPDVRDRLAAATRSAAPRDSVAGAPPRFEAAELREALESGEIAPVYQPKVDLATGRVIGVEALARWTSPTLGLVPPTQFVPVAEAAGLSAAFTDAMLRAALRDMARWREVADVGVAVNVPATALVDVEWPDRVEAALAEAGLPPERLTVEITETVATSEAPLITDILTRLRIKGCLLSLDDFGTGYSSLLTLLRLPFSELKLDRSFVRHCDRDPYALQIVRAMLSLARGFGMRAVAEGVESAEVAALLRDEGCDVAQGYFYAKPMGMADFRALLDAERGPRRPGEDGKPQESLGLA
ncbi:EAL domain-containing response regulator [Alsobacter sp. SYSU M60028]|uniref:EAL domain-containing response regulator n=1 Tax=Alsobacter ponti TaxID=2962936 RepID=A0ABT1LF60_9HYPH|nr:EAL domain-containing response regulator [Alsobacter ponti]MCP8940059.1 EAL domain-containing response regulator [Alsobacter ponti]